MLHDRLGTMVTRANCDPFLIQNRADVVRMYVVYNEREDTCLFARRADDADSLD